MVGMTESRDISEEQPRPQDYAGLREELAELTVDMRPLIANFWPRLEDHKYRWELHRFGLSQEYDTMVVSDIIDHLVDALKGIALADNALLSANTKADGHDPNQPDAD
jgi:hypothetical protein